MLKSKALSKQFMSMKNKPRPRFNKASTRVRTLRPIPTRSTKITKNQPKGSAEKSVGRKIKVAFGLLTSTVAIGYMSIYTANYFKSKAQNQLQIASNVKVNQQILNQQSIAKNDQEKTKTNALLVNQSTTKIEVPIKLENKKNLEEKKKEEKKNPNNKFSFYDELGKKSTQNPITTQEIQETPRNSPKIDLNKKSLYYVQVGSFQQLNQAQQLRDELKSKNFEPVITMGNVSNRIIYRVRIANIQNLEKAKQVEKQLKQLNYQTIIGALAP